jgi:hypothetical protein
MKYRYIKRLSDGAVLDVPLDQLDETLKRGGFEVLPEITVNEITPIEVGNQVMCPLCQKTFRTDHGLKVHKNVHL